MSALITSLIFAVAVSGLCFLPGFFIARYFFGSDFKALSVWEKTLFSFGLSIGLLIFGMITLGHAGVLFTPLSLISLTIIGTLATCALLTLSARRRRKDAPLKSAGWQFTRKQGILFLLIIASTILIKAVYLTPNIIPASTDLGHHMYWAKLISQTGELPVYAEQNIVEEDGRYRITEPEPIADFIIGEHLPFAALDIISQAGFFSAFPIVFLALVNFLAVFALAVFAFHLVRGLDLPQLSAKIWTGENAFLLTLFFFGPLYTLASPQEKFVSGGVVGNTFGILFIPLILLSFYRALKEKDGRFFALGIFFSFTLAYIHHLSTFILAFALVASILAYLALHWKELGATLKEWLLLLCHPLSLSILFLAGLFFFLVAMPTYIETGAVSTAVGTPTKVTRIGLTFTQVTHSAGEARVALGLVGIALLLLLPWRKRHASALLLGWSLIILIMTLRPNWLFVDIPSSRIGAYLSFPLGLLATLATLAFWAFLKAKPGQYFPLPKALLLIIFTSIFFYALGSGGLDNAKTLLLSSKAESTVATFDASRFLAAEAGPDDLILKDHNYITADAWIKLFFLRDYSFPLSRAYFTRYEDNPNREQCTLSMISIPNTPQGDRCYDETGTDIVMVSSLHDAAQFEVSDDFSKLYTSEYVSIYKRQPYAD